MRFSITLFALLLFVPVRAFCQTGVTVPAEPLATTERPAPPAGVEEPSSSRPEPAPPLSNLESDEMELPAPVSTAGYSMEFASETPRTNYLSGGLTFISSYSDNIGGGSTSRISDQSYSAMPTFAWRQSSSRVLWNLAYAPGFTFYQHHSGLNQYTHNLSLDSQFRLSPHVTLSLRDAFAKTSNPFNQLNPDLSTSTGLVQPVATIISPVTEQIMNSGSAQLTYQFGLNSMVGATALFSDLHYLNLPANVSSLANSQTQGAEGFYSQRISGRHYLGAKYQYQHLLTTPIHTQTDTQSVNLFYTIYLNPTTSVSFYAGPQYAESRGGGLPLTKSWSPSYGGSFGREGQRMSFALSGGRSITAGGGLQGAVRAENASVSVRGQLTKAWSTGIGAFYGNNSLLTPQLSATTGGHSVAGTVSLRRQMGQSLGLELAYTRLHQSYPNLSSLAVFPNTNRVWLSLSYQLKRPIGR